MDPAPVTPLSYAVVASLAKVEEREVTPGSHKGLVSVAECGNPGKLESEKEDIGAKPPIGKNVGESVKELNGDDPVDPRPPPVVRDGRRYLSIQR